MRMPILRLSCLSIRDKVYKMHDFGIINSICVLSICYLYDTCAFKYRGHYDYKYK